MCCTVPPDTFSLPAESEVEGWLWKEGEYNVTWRRRWFVIEGEDLVYYKTNVCSLACVC